MNNLLMEKPFINRVSTWSWILLILLIIYQFLFFWNIENIIAIEYTILAWIITTTIFFDKI